MKITFVLPDVSLTGGVRVVAQYAAGLQARGHDVTVVAGAATQLRLRDHLRALLRTGRPAARPQPQTAYFERGGLAPKILDRWRDFRSEDFPDADVIVATWWETAHTVAALPPEKGEKVHFVQHDETLIDVDRADAVAACYRLPLRRITISQWLVDLMADEYGDRAVGMIHNSVDVTLFDAPPRARNATPTVGVMYSAVPFKDFGTSRAAIEILRRRWPDLRVVSFGAHAPTPDMPLPEGTAFTLRPPQAQIADIYAQCDVWLIGSAAEGFCLPVLEAMACRTPVAGTRVGGPIDVISEGVDGRLAPVGDPAALAEAAGAILALPDAQWRAMSDAAYARARRYSWDDATDAFEALLKQRAPTKAA